MTFLTILKILPWALSLVGLAIIAIYRLKNKSLNESIKVKDKSIDHLKGIIVDQGEQIEKKSKQITELMEINRKYEKKKNKVKDGKSATSSMAHKR